MKTRQTTSEPLPASDLFGFGDLVAEIEPATAEQVHVWLKQEQEARMHDWKRYRALLSAAHNAVDGAGLEALADMLVHLRDPRWKPNAKDQAQPENHNHPSKT